MTRPGDRVGLGLIRAISYGGGVDSTALLVLAARGDLDVRIALFADVGRAENPDTMRYLVEFAMPFAARHGIELAVVQRRRRDGTPVDLWDDAIKPSRTVPVPMRMSNGAPGNRTCTHAWKIQPIAKELKRRGASKDQPATLMLGIGVDEYQRMNTSRIAHIVHEYPLIDRRIDRAGAVALIERAGLPVPPKSSCIWCPFKRKAQWHELMRNHPERFANAVQFERDINAKREAIGRDPVWLTSVGRPLDEAITESGQARLFDDDGASCDIGGYCFA